MNSEERRAAARQQRPPHNPITEDDLLKTEATVSPEFVGVDPAEPGGDETVQADEPATVAPIELTSICPLCDKRLLLHATDVYVDVSVTPDGTVLDYGDIRDEREQLLCEGDCETPAIIESLKQPRPE